MAANCVTNLQKKQAEYIAALDKFNIPDSNLEMLLHKWQNLPENAELFRQGKLSFPSDEWLQEHLYAPASVVSEPRILEIYDKHLSKPIITDTIESANSIVRAISKIISKDSVKILPTKDGKYQVVVTRPKLNNTQLDWARTAENNYEVSSQGDKRFSALYATFKEGTIIDGEDVGGKTIEWVYQNIIKKSGKGKAPSKDSKLFIPSREGYKGDIIPSEDTIFVFGSNPEGRHGAGAAKVAKDKFGAQYGVGEGLTGNAYALPTKDLRVKENKGLRSIPKESIIESIKTLYKVATENPGKQFKVAFRNKLDEATLSGYTGEEMIDMFLSARPIPSNIIFSEEWLNTGKFNLSKQEIEDFSYEKGYLPLWQEWAKQNPELIEELRKATVGKTLTDKFASTRVSQARALADILNSYQQLEKQTQETSEKEFASTDTVYTESQNGITNVTSSEYPLPVTEKPKASDNLTTEDREKSENEVFFEQQSELARQLNTIYGVDAVFTGAEYGQIVHDIIYKISDIITEVERNPEAALRYNSNIQDTSVLKNADRKNIFALLGFDNILNFISSEYFHPANNTAIDGRKAIKQAKIIRDNIKAFVKSGMSLFAQLEQFSLPSIDNLELVDTESNTTDPNVNEADDSVEFLQEMVGDSQEAWQRESRTEVAYDRASILVKQALTQCYKLNPDGTPITDKWGVKQRMDGREALQAIIKWTQGALTLSSMIKKLESHATKEKWLQPIIDRLKDTSGKEAAFQSQFFGAVSKYFQLYSIGKNTGKVGKKNYTVFEVNTHPALTEAKRGISGQYNAGVHPLFDSNGNVNSTSFEQLKTISETIHKMQYSEDNTQQIAELLSDASMLLGYPVSVEIIQEILNADTFKQMTANSLLFIVKGIENNKNKDTWQPFSAKKEDDGIINNIGKFIEPITSRLEDVANTSFYDSGNMYQSYVIPSYLTKLIQKMSLSTKEEYTEFIEKEYGKFAQFKDSKSQWRNSWLQLLQDIPDARHLFTHKVQLNFDGNKYMVSRGGARSMSDADLTLSIIAEYFKEEGANSTKRLAPAWFRVPLMSNKPSSEFIKFYSYRGPDYKNRVLNGCLHLFRQELSRMQTVKKRLEIFEKGSPELIQSFDGERGLKFCFFDFLNNVDNSRFKELVEKYTTNTITEQEKGELSDLGKALIQRGIEEEWQKQLTEWQNNGVVEAAGNIQNISKDNVEKALENFFWNDFLASNNILNLTITDLAYYKNTEDVQKRLAQLHAPGIRANIEATDFEGKKVSDGYTRTIYLKDLEIDGKTLKSNIIENVKVVFNRKLETLKGTPQYDAAKAAYNSIIESFEKGINVTDAQGYASISSYRKKALLFGKWNTQAEEIYQKIISDEYTYTDIQTIFQPLKPFVYTQIEKDSDVDGVELPTIKMGVQNKNSEYLLIMAAAITQNEDTGMPNYLRAIYKVMEESHKDSVKGIDTVQFESTVKTGLTGVIDISEATTTEEAEELLRDAIYNNKDTREYDKTFVQELPFEDYCIQQEVPAHFRDHEQQQGSQIRMITVSDLNPNETYMVEGREVSAEEFRNEYEQTIAANIQESINQLIEEFNLSPDATTKDRNIALAKVLQKEILSSPRYGIDLLMSCLLDENGKFMLPLGDPIQSKRIEQLINSIVKNRINKQKIAGGPIVQVSNFGTSRQLNIRFKGKNGETLETLNDYISEGKTEQEWVKYIKENQAGIAYYEAFVPVYASEVFEDFMDAQGNIDIEAVEAVNPDLLKMIGYRIPSEDKYSMAPIKVVGFMPKEAGDGIMLPYEITLITGSDRDVIVSTSII